MARNRDCVRSSERPSKEPKAQSSFMLIDSVGAAALERGWPSCSSAWDLSMFVRLGLVLVWVG